MGIGMKTTIEISDALLEAARRVAQERGTTVRALVEAGLRTIVDQERTEFTLREASVGGTGLHPDIREGGWQRMIEFTYEGRGG